MSRSQKKVFTHGGFAFGSGNSIPEYVPADNFVMMNEIIRELRGEYGSRQ